MGEWQDIATAPRDGTMVLLYRPLAHRSHDPHIAMRRTTSYARHCFAATVPDGADGKNFTEGACYATHWQPLPEPPK